MPRIISKPGQLKTPTTLQKIIDVRAAQHLLYGVDKLLRPIVRDLYDEEGYDLHFSYSKAMNQTIYSLLGDPRSANEDHEVSIYTLIEFLQARLDQEASDDNSR